MYMRPVRRIFIAIGILSLSSCYSVTQAWHQVALFSKRQPIDSVIEKEATPPQIKAKLSEVKRVIQFAENAGLETGSSYRHFVALDRDALTYGVQAAEVDRLELVTWWFPIVGKAPYLGFFNRADRDAKAEELKAAGYDVAVFEIDAFSSLGWFPDPVYQPMLKKRDYDLAHLLFHELTHRTLWISGQPEFNENLAEFVGEHLTKKYLATPEAREDLARYEQKREDRILFHAWLGDLKKDLETLFSQKLPREELLKKKAELYKTYQTEKKPKFKRAQYIDDKPWNNAYLLGSVLYSPNRQLFEKALTCHGDKLPEFLKALEKKVKDLDISGEEALLKVCQV